MHTKKPILVGLQWFVILSFISWLIEYQVLWIVINQNISSNSEYLGFLVEATKVVENRDFIFFQFIIRTITYAIPSIFVGVLAHRRILFNVSLFALLSVSLSLLISLILNAEDFLKYPMLNFIEIFYSFGICLLIGITIKIKEHA